MSRIAKDFVVLLTTNAVLIALIVAELSGIKWAHWAQLPCWVVMGIWFVDLVRALHRDSR